NEKTGQARPRERSPSQKTVSKTVTGGTWCTQTRKPPVCVAAGIVAARQKRLASPSGGFALCCRKKGCANAKTASALKMPKEKKLQPPQHQKRQPGREYKMKPRPKAVDENQRASGKLRDKVAIITGGDSGIGRAVAIAFAREGADVAVVYLEEHKDANETRRLVEKEGVKCLLIDGDVGDEEFCKKAVAQSKQRFGGIDILINNAAEQHLQESIEKITAHQLERTFRTNIFSFFFMTKAAMKHLKKTAKIFNTTPVTPHKGGNVSFSRSLSQGLAKKGIRVNGVAPGPIWAPLIPSSFPERDVATFG